MSYLVERKVNGERIKQIRELYGWSQTELANKINITQAAVALIESNRFDPTDELLNQISFQTGFPVSFFKKTKNLDIPLGSLLYRAKMKATIKEQTQVRRHAQLVCQLLYEALLHRIKSIPVKVPRLEENPSEAAKITRSSLGLPPDKPIEHLMSVLEKAGIIILVVPFHAQNIDAFSFWLDETQSSKPVIVLVDGYPGDRLRFSLAHELGHLVLHTSVYGKGKKIDEEANDFASEFLVPEEAIFEELLPPVKLSDLAELKLRWKVSMQALMYRARKLEIITLGQYKYLLKQMGINGWRQEEPINIPPEKPRLLCQLAELKYGIPINLKRLAHDVSIPMHFVEQILNCYLSKDNAYKSAPSGKIFSLFEDKK